MGTRVRQIWTRKALSQAEVARRAGFTREYVNKIEAGRYDPPLSTLNSLARALGVAVRELLG